MEPNEHQPTDDSRPGSHSETSDDEQNERAQSGDSVDAGSPNSAESVSAGPSETPLEKPKRRMTRAEYREYLDKKIRRMYPWSVILFFAACASTWYIGGQTPTGFDNTAGMTYSAAVMGILLAHELGHYL